MTISTPVVPLGAQRPRLVTLPAGAVSSAGVEAAELAATAGLVLDDWQRHVLDVALGERADGSWAAFEVGLLVPRQNGKGAVLEARELAGLFLFGEQLILHSAHEFKTAAEAFRRVLSLIENTDHLRKRVKKIRTSHGEEGVELLSGARLRFVARSTGSGRGFSGDCVILDEAYNLGSESMAALLPTLSARPNPQLWYTSSAPMTSSTQLHRVRRRALNGGSERMAFLEWSADEDDDPDDPATWAKANPSLGLRIDAEFVAAEIEAMPVEVFRRERLGIPDPAPDAQPQVLPSADWTACVDVGSHPGSRLAMAVDVTPDHSWASIAVASRRPDGALHVEVIDERPGTGWVMPRVKALHEQHEPAGWALDPAGPAGAFIPRMADVGIAPELVSGRELGQACGALLAAVVERRLRHLDQSRLNLAVAGAKRRPLGDAWAWARKDMSVNIAPLVAVTLAAWLADRDEQPEVGGELWASWS